METVEEAEGVGEEMAAGSGEVTEAEVVLEVGATGAVSEAEVTIEEADSEAGEEVIAGDLVVEEEKTAGDSEEAPEAGMTVEDSAGTILQEAEVDSEEEEVEVETGVGEGSEIAVVEVEVVVEASMITTPASTTVEGDSVTEAVAGTGAEVSPIESERADGTRLRTKVRTGRGWRQEIT